MTPLARTTLVTPRDAGRTSDGRAGSLSARQRTLVALESLIALCGLGGGIWLMASPVTALSLTYLDGTWFASWRWPGFALAVFVGVCPLLVVGATVARRRIAVIGHLCVGIGLIAWVALEAAWVVVSPGLQLAVGAIGVAMLVLGARECVTRRDGQGPGSAR